MRTSSKLFDRLQPDELSKLTAIEWGGILCLQAGVRAGIFSNPTAAKCIRTIIEYRRSAPPHRTSNILHNRHNQRFPQEVLDIARNPRDQTLFSRTLPRRVY